MCCYWLNDYCNILHTQHQEKLLEQLQEKHLIAINRGKKLKTHKAGAGKTCKATLEVILQHFRITSVWEKPHYFNEHNWLQ